MSSTRVVLYVVFGICEVANRQFCRGLSSRATVGPGPLPAASRHSSIAGDWSIFAPHENTKVRIRVGLELRLGLRLGLELWLGFRLGLG